MNNQPPLVLVADDYDDLAPLIADLIERSIACEALAVKDGATALATVLARRPAACVLETDLPTMSGIEVARAVQEVLGLEAPLLVALTSSSALDASATGLFDVVLSKPLQVDRLVSLLRTEVRTDIA